MTSGKVIANEAKAKAVAEATRSITHVMAAVNRREATKCSRTQTR